MQKTDAPASNVHLQEISVRPPLNGHIWHGKVWELSALKVATGIYVRYGLIPAVMASNR